MTDATPPPSPPEPEYYLERGLLVFTAAYHLKRGSCCGSGCRHCPYEPRHVAGTTTPAPAAPSALAADRDQGTGRRAAPG